MNRINQIRDYHENIYSRSYQILQYVIELLELGTPQSVILEIIRACTDPDETETLKSTLEELTKDIE